MNHSNSADYSPTSKKITAGIVETTGSAGSRDKSSKKNLTIKNQNSKDLVAVMNNVIDHTPGLR